MATLKMDRHASYHRSRKADSREYWMLFALLYPTLLVVALFGRIHSLVHAGTLGPRDGHRSIFGEARAAAASIIPFAFK